MVENVELYDIHALFGYNSRWFQLIGYFQKQGPTVLNKNGEILSTPQWHVQKEKMELSPQPFFDVWG